MATLQTGEMLSGLENCESGTWRAGAKRSLRAPKPCRFRSSPRFELFLASLLCLVLELGLLSSYLSGALGLALLDHAA